MGIQKIIRDTVSSILPITVTVVVGYMLSARASGEDVLVFLVAAVLAAAGLVIFLFGVEHSLLPMGEMVGGALMTRGGFPLLLGVGFVVGFAVTLAEPGVMAVAQQAEAAGGELPHRYLFASVVSFGVGVFVVLALLKTVFDISLVRLLTWGYAAVLVLGFFAPAPFVAFAFDFGGATTGPVTVPFILALGVGTSAVIGGRGQRRESFGYLALASIGPILSVLLLGIMAG